MVYIGDVDADPRANPKAIFSDRELNTALANPQVLDANGRTTNKIWLSGRYSLEVRDINDVQVFQDLDRGENESDIAGIALGNIIGGDTITAESTPTQTSYVDKETYIFTVAQVNTGPVTLNIDGIGARPVKKNNREELISGDLVVGDNIAVMYNATNSEFIMNRQIDEIEGYIFGLTISNNSINPDEEINVSSGQAASNNTISSRMMVLPAFAKRVTGTFVAGSGADGLDTGTVQADTWYHVFLIMRPDTNATDILISSSVDNPIMPANYTLRRRIGSILTDTDSDIILFTQRGDEFLWDTVVQDVNTTTTTSVVLRTLSVPLGVKVIWRGAMRLDSGGSAGTVSGGAYSPDLTTAPTASFLQLFARDAGGGTTGAGASAECSVRTNTSSQVNTIFDRTSGSIGIQMNTLGWLDDRGASL